MNGSIYDRWFSWAARFEPIALLSWTISGFATSIIVGVLGNKETGVCIAACTIIVAFSVDSWVRIWLCTKELKEGYLNLRVELERNQHGIESRTKGLLDGFQDPLITNWRNLVVDDDPLFSALAREKYNKTKDDFGELADGRMIASTPRDCEKVFSLLFGGLPGIHTIRATSFDELLAWLEPKDVWMQSYLKLNEDAIRDHKIRIVRIFIVGDSDEGLLEKVIAMSYQKRLASEIWVVDAKKCDAGHRAEADNCLLFYDQNDVLLYSLKALLVEGTSVRRFEVCRGRGRQQVEEAFSKIFHLATKSEKKLPIRKTAPVNNDFAPASEGNLD